MLIKKSLSSFWLRCLSAISLRLCEAHVRWKAFSVSAWLAGAAPSPPPLAETLKIEN